MIIIDHNFAHLFELCDRVNVMQGGRITIDQLTKDTSLEQLTELMVSSYRSQLQQAAAQS
jgi:ABC-type sugar transport system ATPase subunit